MPHSIVTQYDNIRKKPWLVELFPWIGGGTSTTIYPNIYLSRAVYKSIYSAKPDPYKISTVIHEEEHISRIRKVGIIKWYGRYFISQKFRFEEELAATRPQFAYIKAQGLTFDLNRRARVLSGHLYGWPVSYKKALTRLTELWDSV